MLDTNVIVDLLGDVEGADGSWSRKTYRRLSAFEQFGCNLVVVAEIAAQEKSLEEVIDRFALFRIEIIDLTLAASFAAGKAHVAYRRRGGRREAMLADFLIGGHAEALGAPLVTRDRRLAAYFPDLTLITPETHP